MLIRVLAFVALMLAAGAPAAAQDGPAPAQEPLDLSRLPIDLERIREGLREAADREERDGLTLRYTVAVYGQAPAIELFAPDANLEHGPVPYGAPTHRQMLEQMTPREFRSPAADIGAAIRWLVERANR